MKDINAENILTIGLPPPLGEMDFFWNLDVKTQFKCILQNQASMDYDDENYDYDDDSGDNFDDETGVNKITLFYEKPHIQI